MSDPPLEHISGRKTGRDILQDEKHVPDRPAREGAVRAGGQLRGGEGVGGPAHENLSDERQPAEEVPPVGLHQRAVAMVGRSLRQNHFFFLPDFFHSCKSPNELAPGCSEVSRTDNNYHMTLDPERDLQRIHSLIITHNTTLEAFINLFQSEETICNILKQLREVAYQIEQKHRTYKRTLDRNIKYGSL